MRILIYGIRMAKHRDFAIKYNKTEIADILRKHDGKTAEELKAAGN